MKGISIRLKVTVWYTLLVAVLALTAIIAVAAVRNRAGEEYYRQTLLSTAQLSADDIEYVDGEIAIDRNLDEMANVRAAVFDMAGGLIYGKTRFDVPFEDGELRYVADRGGNHWYVMDSIIQPDGGDAVWLRLYIASDASDAMNSGSMVLMLALAPLIVLLAALGGWLITKAAFRPVVHISKTTAGIMDGRDLKKRVALPAARDEIYSLATVMDTMLERLDESFERERRFTSDAAHELRTPIAAILAQSGAALETGGDMRGAMEDINNRAKGMAELVSELLALTRMDAGRTALDYEYVDIAEICQVVAEITESGAEVTEDGDCTTMCDQSMITRVVMNLVENAVKYAGDGAVIRIFVHGEADNVSFSVRDNGPGIAEGDMPHIFERFYQGDRARAAKGAGLGLAMVRQIVLLHGGKVTAQNDGGAVFTVTLPRRKENG